MVVNQRPLICLAGPTASGKTGLALQLARRWPVEVISVDSALVYRGMDIGTAKPTADEQRQVRHHLLDGIDPEDSYSSARFVREAQAAAADIRRRGGIPLLVGGTMLYFQALLYGQDDLPATDPRIREKWQAVLDAMGLDALYAALQQVDPPTAARLKPGDRQRILRALEVFEMTGKPLSSFQSTQGARVARLEHHFVSLEPGDRAWLHARIADRFDAMLAQGFEDEMRRLMARPGLCPTTPAMRAVGYRQAWQWLTGDLSFEDMRAQAIAATRQLAKRQLTWLRSWPQKTVIACDGADPAGELEKLLDGWL